MKRIKTILLMGVLVLALLLCSCETKITEGEIYEKEFKPEETQLIPITTIITTGKVFIPVTNYYHRHYPDRYIIRIRQYNEAQNTFLYNEYYVDEETYNKANIGDWFIYNEAYLESEPYTQEKAEEVTE
jgi:hypothetical protein